MASWIYIRPSTRLLHKELWNTRLLLSGRVFVLSFEGNVSDDTWYLGYKPKYLGAFYLFIFVVHFLRNSPPPPQWSMASSFTRFLDHTQRRITVGRTPLVEWSARRTDLYRTTHNSHNIQTSMPSVVFGFSVSNILCSSSGRLYLTCKII
jgi:hypothetical protein